MKATGTRPKIIVSADGRGVVGHVGARLLADVAEATGLLGGFGDALAGLRQRQSGHDPGRVAIDVAVMLTDGGGGWWPADGKATLFNPAAVRTIRPRADEFVGTSDAGTGSRKDSHTSRSITSKA